MPFSPCRKAKLQTARRGFPPRRVEKKRNGRRGDSLLAVLNKEDADREEGKNPPRQIKHTRALIALPPLPCSLHPSSSLSRRWTASVQAMVWQRRMVQVEDCR